MARKSKRYGGLTAEEVEKIPTGERPVDAPDRVCTRCGRKGFIKTAPIHTELPVPSLTVFCRACNHIECVRPSGSIEEVPLD